VRWSGFERYGAPGHIQIRQNGAQQPRQRSNRACERIGQTAALLLSTGNGDVGMNATFCIQFKEKHSQFQTLRFLAYFLFSSFRFAKPSGAFVERSMRQPRLNFSRFVKPNAALFLGGSTPSKRDQDSK